MSPTEAHSPRISVVVPLYNKARTVLRTLQSIAVQTFGDFEVLIVDDGSTDDSAALVESVADPRFRMIRQANAGPGAARNRGIAEARADLVAFLDADDVWLPRFLETATAQMDANPESAAVTLGWFDEPGHRSCVPDMETKWKLPSGEYRLTAASSPYTMLGLSIAMWPCTTVTRRNIALRFGGFYEKRCTFAEDAHLWMKVLLHYPIRLHWEPLAEFHRDASALSGNYRKMRGVEPFLTDPEDLRRECPPELRPVLEGFLSLRAMKTASVMAYWGLWREAAALRHRFPAPGGWRSRWYWISLGAATPLGAIGGKIWRTWKSR